MEARMKQSVLAFFAGLIGWVLVVSLLNRGLRLWLSGYAAAEPSMHFTLPMMLARLTIAVITTLAAGAIVHAVAPASRRTPWVLGLVMLAAFVPEHVALWRLFPVWYHLFFLITLVPLFVLGARLAPHRQVKEGNT